MPDNVNETTGRRSGVDASLARSGGLSYLEIPAFDVQRSAQFYERILGWGLQHRQSNDVRFADLTGHLIGRWVTGRAISREPGMLAYFYVDRIHDAVEQAVSCGGEVAKAPCPEGDIWVATVRDPAGNVIGLWQQRSNAPTA
jgi:predicted enzyme related to lactoylglutathione lyase